VQRDCTSCFSQDPTELPEPKRSVGSDTVHSCAYVLPYYCDRPKQAARPARNRDLLAVPSPLSPTPSAPRQAAAIDGYVSPHRVRVTAGRPHFAALCCDGEASPRFGVARFAVALHRLFRWADQSVVAAACKR
jgi:hypothetical protein